MLHRWRLHGHLRDVELPGADDLAVRPVFADDGDFVQARRFESRRDVVYERRPFGRIKPESSGPQYRGFAGLDVAQDKIHLVFAVPAVERAVVPAWKPERKLRGLDMLENIDQRFFSAELALQDFFTENEIAHGR